MSDLRLRRLRRAQAEGRLTSVVGAVFDRHGQVWSGAVGDTPGLDAQYRIGSITKTFTAVLVAQARDQGLLHLDARVGTYLGDVGYADATLRELLAHTSGMQSEPTGPWWERTRGNDFVTLAAANRDSGRVALPGEWFHYSNLGYGMLGEVLARVTGRPWRDLVASALLAPLGMRRTSYLPRPGAQPGWSVDHFTGVRVHEPITDTGAMAAAGQLWSTVGDLTTWGHFLAGARPDLLAPSSLAELFEPVTPEYGLGFRLDAYAGGRLVGHSGSMPGFLAGLLVDPVSGIGGALLTNATTGIDPLALVTELIDGEPGRQTELPPRWVPTTMLPPEVEGLPGVWFWGNSAYELRWNNETLELHDMARGVLSDRFVVDMGRLVGAEGYHRGERMHVHRAEDGTVRHLECATFVYTRAPYDPEAPIPGGVPGPV